MFDCTGICAIGPDGEFAIGDQLWYSHPDDMKLFALLTQSLHCGAIIAGRATAKTIPDGLKGRDCYILSNCSDYFRDFGDPDCELPNWKQFPTDMLPGGKHEHWLDDLLPYGASVIGGLATFEAFAPSIGEWLITHYETSRGIGPADKYFEAERYMPEGTKNSIVYMHNDFVIRKYEVANAR